MSANEKAAGSTLTREAVLRALQSLSEELGKQEIMGEICLFGGTAMMLAFTARLMTADIIFRARRPKLKSAKEVLDLVSQ